MFNLDKSPIAGSGDIAKNRLDNIIMQDRMERSPQVLEHIKSEIIAVMENYLEFDESQIEIDLWMPSGKVAGEAPTLTTSFPIKAWKRRYEDGQEGE
ncbi:MAG: cell division topological specificity factor MinE [Defluviitaleaceae bacterium]|nr:cell division topological specificity factor MinE [Defluviitaleaceae bacterium]